MFSNNIDLYNPDFVIDCSKLLNCRDIYTKMRNQGIVKAYVYGMCFKPGPLTYDFSKVGKSCPNLGEKREYQVGERITRQLSWVPGWKEEQVHSSHGADFWLGIERILIPQGLLPTTFNKNDVTIAVWDISKRMFTSDVCEDDEEKATGWAEGLLAKQYKDMFGRLPNLNHQDPTKTKHYTQGYVPKSIWNKLFEFA
jgi:hypothetical protein